jgi:hypothetical protein
MDAEEVIGKLMVMKNRNWFSFTFPLSQNETRHLPS